MFLTFALLPFRGWGLNVCVQINGFTFGYSYHCFFESWFLTFYKTFFCITRFVFTGYHCSIYINYIDAIKFFSSFFNFKLICLPGYLKSITTQFILLAICFFG